MVMVEISTTIFIGNLLQILRKQIQFKILKTTLHVGVYTKVVLISPLTNPGFMFILLCTLRASLIHDFRTTCKQKDITKIYIFITTPHYRVYQKMLRIQNCF